MTEIHIDFIIFSLNTFTLLGSTIYLKSLNILQKPIIYWRIWRMDCFYERSALLGFVKYNKPKPQINADERRFIDGFGKSVCAGAGFGVGDVRVRGYCEI